MQDDTILTSRASQIASQIHTPSSLNEAELKQLIEHSQWQAEHIKAIEAHSQWQAEHIQAIEAHNQWQAEHIKAIEAHSQWQAEHITAIEAHNEWQSQHIATLEAQPSYSNGLVPHLSPTVTAINQPASNATIHPNVITPSVNNNVLEQNMLGQIQQNTLFLQNIVAQQLHQQQKALDKREKKVSALQNSVSWQITGPIRSGQKLVNGVSKVSTTATITATQGVSKVQAYINQRPKLKDNLLRMTGLKDLYTQKDAITNKKK